MPGKTDLEISLRRGVRKLAEPVRQLRTLIDMYRARRQQARYVGRAIGITGSVGKTTATDLTRRLLQADHSVVFSDGRNIGRDAIGALLKLKGPVDFIVQEISALPAREYHAALKAIELDVGVVTRVGLDHQSLFRTEDAVAREKGRLVENVRAGGIVCLNADDDRCRAMAARSRARVVLYGQAMDAEIRAEAVDATWPNRMSFDLVIGGVRRRVQTSLVGTIFLPSVLAALSVVHGLGLDLDAALSRLASIEPVPWRLSVVEGHASGHTFVLDTFKASFWSTQALIDDLKNWGSSRRVFVLGDMSDIRNDESRRYRQTLRRLAENADLVIGAGARGSSAARKVALDNVAPAGTVREVAGLLAAQPGSLVILKGNKSFPLDAVAGHPSHRLAPRGSAFRL